VDAYDLLNQAISVIPGFSSPRYQGGSVNRDVAQTGYIPPGQLAYTNGKPVYFVDSYYGYQSPEGFKKATGNYPKGYTPSAQAAVEMPSVDQPEAKRPDSGDTGATDQPAAGAVSPTPGASAPSTGPSLEGEGAKQEQEPITDKTLERIEEIMSLPYQEGLSKLRTRNLIEAATVMSALRAPRERQKQAAEIERRNIEAWQAIKTAQIEANARQQMALGLATVSAMTPNLSNFAEIYKASTAPFNIRPRG
jgi:hypothetical protein